MGMVMVSKRDIGTSTKMSVVEAYSRMSVHMNGAFPAAFRKFTCMKADTRVK